MNTATAIDWTRLDKLESGVASNDASQNTCRLAEIIAKSVKGSEDPLMELAMQIAIWREAYADLRQEFRMPADAAARKAMGFTDVQDVIKENDQLRIVNSRLRYTMQGMAEKLTKEANA
jgi:hypothetical protein